MNLLATLKPNISSMGYALFLAINAAGVWGGSFPFLPSAFQTPLIVYGFFGAQALVFGLSYVASAAGVYFFPGPTRRFLVIAAGVPYFAGWACLIAAMYIDAAALAFMIAGGALLGLGSAGFYMLWQRLFASQDSEQGTRDLIVGTAYSAVMYFALYLIPRSVTALLIPVVFLPLFGLSIVLKSRTIDANQPMFEDVPREHPQVYTRALLDFWPSALSVGALGLCCGVVRSLAVNDAYTGSIVNVISMLGSLVSAVVLLALWQRKDLRINVVTVYRALFPFVITAFFLLAFLGLVAQELLVVFAGTMYAFYSFGIMLMMLQCAQASRDRGINPIFIYGFFGGTVYIAHDLGFMGGMGAEGLTALGLNPIAAASILALWLLSIMYFMGQGGFKRALAPGRTQADSIEFMALNAVGENAAEPKAAVPLAENAAEQKAHAPHEAGAGKDNNAVYRDRTSKQCAALSRHYRLSSREAEVMELLARGNTIPAIAEELVVSENTIRTHARRIYSKLAIHKRQELLDLVNAFTPESAGNAK